jgi:hypothetical protein
LFDQARRLIHSSTKAKARETPFRGLLRLMLSSTKACHTAPMTKREIAALACRLLAIYALIGAFDLMAAFAALVVSESMSPGFVGAPVPNALVTLIPAEIRLLVAGALWFFADGLAASMADAPDHPKAHIVSADFRSVAFSVLGAFFLVGATANLAAMAIQVILPISVGSSQFFPAELMRNLVTFALGLWLLLGARGIVRGVASLRNVGRDSTP